MYGLIVRSAFGWMNGMIFIQATFITIVITEALLRLEICENIWVVWVVMTFSLLKGYNLCKGWLYSFFTFRCTKEGLYIQDWLHKGEDGHLIHPPNAMLFWGCVLETGFQFSSWIFEIPNVGFAWVAKRELIALRDTCTLVIYPHCAHDCL